MAAAALTPRVRVMLVCDGLRASRLEEGVFDLRGARHHIRAASFPFRPRRLWLYLVLSNRRRGRYPGYVRITDDQSERAVFQSNFEAVFQEDLGLVWIPMRLKCTFPHQGQYTLQIWFFQDARADVVKGEQSFIVLEA
jgi:hypothetical protein